MGYLSSAILLERHLQICFEVVMTMKMTSRSDKGGEDANSSDLHGLDFAILLLLRGYIIKLLFYGYL